MAQFYDPNITEDQKTAVLSEEESKHICKVLRMNTGDKLEMVNGVGMLFKATIEIADPRKCKIIIHEVYKEQNDAYHLHLAIAPTKNMDRIEWFLEKVTEIGVHEISFLLCDNSERKIVKMDRLEKIVLAAMKQSQRLFLPKLNELVNFKNFITQNPKGLIAHCENMADFENNKNKTIPKLIAKENQPILIGPEGDFSKKEIDLALKSGYQAITLGKNRLRTETAGLYALLQTKLHLESL